MSSAAGSYCAAVDVCEQNTSLLKSPEMMFLVIIGMLGDLFISVYFLFRNTFVKVSEPGVMVPTYSPCAWVAEASGSF